ncbi:hypothetical protein GWI33_019854 [Rhynchophorus ferrugineus]|uniref:Uncharacterized protein n=1 Tax=Rhynchophorus ferrugineus TaxID=354439 RepID=A0A834HVC6_RHYFE|nr:hypothetical protein GWI33_019854 [Rhynchophorus ferrugineus]
MQLPLPPARRADGSGAEGQDRARAAFSRGCSRQPANGVMHRIQVAPAEAGERLKIENIPGESMGKRPGDDVAMCGVERAENVIMERGYAFNGYSGKRALKIYSVKHL